MPREPMKRQAGQGITAMTEQLAANRIDRSPKSRLYPEMSAEIKAQALDASIRQQQELLNEMDRRGKVDLENLSAVKQACNDYLESCRRASVYPSMTALAPSLGYSRQYLYSFMGKYNTPVTQYLDALRSSMAAIVQQAGLTRTADAAMSIFILKNSAGMSDKLEMSVTPPAEEEKKEIDVAQIEREFFDGNDSEWEAYKRGDRPYSWNDINDPNFIHHTEPRPMWEGYEDEWLKTHDPAE